MKNSWPEVWITILGFVLFLPWVLQVTPAHVNPISHESSQNGEG